MAVGQQLCVQLSQIARRRYRDPVVAAEVAHFAFHPALLVAFAGRAEIGLILPVRTEGDEAGRQLPLIAAQDLLYCTRQVVVAKPAENAAEVMERQLVCFQKRLLRGPQVSAMIGRSTSHRTKRKHLQLDALAWSRPSHLVLSDTPSLRCWSGSISRLPQPRLSRRKRQPSDPPDCAANLNIPSRLPTPGKWQVGSI